MFAVHENNSLTEGLVIVATIRDLVKVKNVLTKNDTAKRAQMKEQTENTHSRKKLSSLCLPLCWKKIPWGVKKQYCQNH